MNTVVRRLFALPFLPHRKIKNAFENIISENDSNDPRIAELFNYFERTWLRSVIWSPRNISVYHRLVRTNNDVEAYHRRLNNLCRIDHPPFYKLLPILFNESKLTRTTAKLVSNQAVKLQRRKQTTETQAQISELWDKYDADLIEENEFISVLSSFMAFKVPNN